LIVVEYVSNRAGIAVTCLHIVGVTGGTEGDTDSVGSQVVVGFADCADGALEGETVGIERND